MFAQTAAQINQNALVPELEGLATDLTALARQGKFPPFVGRERELNALTSSLLRETRNFAVLVGEAGVGKTAIVHEFANRIARQSHLLPQALRNRRILALNYAESASGKGRFTAPQIAQLLLDYASKHPEVIFFIDEIHLWLDSRDANFGAILSNALKPAITQREIRLIGATTTQEWYRFIRFDPALERRASVIFVQEPDSETTLEILKAICYRLQMHHRIIIPEERLRQVLDICERSLPHLHFPDKAIDLLDAAAAQAQMRRALRPETSFELLVEDVEEALKAHMPSLSFRWDFNQRLEKLKEALRKHAIEALPIFEPLKNMLLYSVKQGKELNRPLLRLMMIADNREYNFSRLARLISDTLFGEGQYIEVMPNEGAITQLLGASPSYIGYSERASLLAEKLQAGKGVLIYFGDFLSMPSAVRALYERISSTRNIMDNQGRAIDLGNAIILTSATVSARQQQSFLPLSANSAVGVEADKSLYPKALRELPKGSLSSIDLPLFIRTLGREQLLTAVQDLLRERLEHLASQYHLSVELSPQAWEHIKRQSSAMVGMAGVEQVVEQWVARLFILMESQRLPEGVHVIIGIDTQGEFVAEVMHAPATATADGQDQDPQTNHEHEMPGNLLYLLFTER